MWRLWDLLYTVIKIRFAYYDYISFRLLFFLHNTSVIVIPTSQPAGPFIQMQFLLAHKHTMLAT